MIFKSLIQRQKIHMKMLTTKLSTSIQVDIDRMMIDSYGHKYSVRDLVLDIKVQEKDSPLYGTSLFHGIDFCGDTSKIWMGNQTGPGGAVHVFTFYQAVQEEATQMIRGMGRYIARTHGTKIATTTFEPGHFEAAKGWKYDKQNNKFITP